MDKKLDKDLKKAVEDFIALSEKHTLKDEQDLIFSILNGESIDKEKYDIEKTSTGTTYTKKKPIDPSVARVKKKINDLLNN